jgi:hypothetical protein
MHFIPNTVKYCFNEKVRAKGSHVEISAVSTKPLNHRYRYVGSWDSSVGIATTLRAVPPRIQSSIFDTRKTCFLLHNAHTVSGTRPASYTMSTVSYFSGDKTAGA